MMNPAKNDLKYCLYARKSSESDERQAMSIDSQIKEMRAMADREGLNVIEIKQESFSAKESGHRPVFKGITRSKKREVRGYPNLGSRSPQ
jgi:site-specific DNA recombinase